MTWAQIPVLVTIGTLMLTITLLAMDERNRRKFSSREDVNGMRERLEKDIHAVGVKLTEGLARKRALIERNAGLFVQLDDRVGHLEQTTSLLEERQTQQWGRISEQMASTARTIEGVTQRLERISEMQQDFAIRIERIQRVNERPHKP